MAVVRDDADAIAEENGQDLVNAESMKFIDSSLSPRAVRRLHRVIDDSLHRWTIPHLAQPPIHRAGELLKGERRVEPGGESDGLQLMIAPVVGVELRRQVERLDFSPDADSLQHGPADRRGRGSFARPSVFRRASQSAHTGGSPQPEDLSAARDHWRWTQSNDGGNSGERFR